MTTENNNQGDVNESQSQDANSSNEQNGAQTALDLNSRLAELLGDDPLISQAEADEADSNQSEDQESEGEPEMDTNTEDGEEVHSQSEDNEDENVSRGVQKRIDKLTAKRKDAETQLEALRKEVEDLKTQQSAPRQSQVLPDVPHSDLHSVAEIEAEIAQARNVRNWAEANAEGFTQTNEDGTETYYDPAQIRQIKVNAMKALEESLPQRYQYIQARDSIEPIANKEYPWWKDKSSAERQIAEKFLSAFPQIKKFPDYKMVIGDYIRGVKARESNLKSNKVIPKAPTFPRSSGSVPSMKKQDVQKGNAMARFQKTGKVDDLSSVIEDYL